MSTDTPKTEAALIDNADLYDTGHGKSEMVPADFARKLEREITRLTTERNRFEAEKLKIHDNWTTARTLCAEGAAKIDEQRAEITRLKTSEARLREALERSLSWLTSYPGDGALGKSGPYEQARAALAATTEEQP